MFGKRNAKMARVIFDDATSKQHSRIVRAIKTDRPESAATVTTSQTTDQHSSLAAMDKLKGLFNTSVPPMFIWSAVMCIKRMVRNRAKRKKV
jgi:hypothetical protein